MNVQICMGTHVYYMCSCGSQSLIVSPFYLLKQAFAVLKAQGFSWPWSLGGHFLPSKWETSMFCFHVSSPPCWLLYLFCPSRLLSPVAMLASMWSHTCWDEVCLEQEYKVQRAAQPLSAYPIPLLKTRQRPKKAYCCKSLYLRAGDVAQQDTACFPHRSQGLIPSM